MIRTAELADVPRIVAMGDRFIADVYAQAIVFNPDMLASLTKKLIDGAGVVFVAERERDIVGMIALIIIQQPMSGELIATELVWWVDPERRGGRQALELLDAAEDWGRKQGATRLQMIAPSDRVCQFYERIGFQRVEVAYSRPL